MLFAIFKVKDKVDEIGYVFSFRDILKVAYVFENNPTLKEMNDLYGFRQCWEEHENMGTDDSIRRDVSFSTNSEGSKKILDVLRMLPLDSVLREWIPELEKVLAS